MKLSGKLITKYLLYVLPIVYLYFFRHGYLRFIVLFSLEASLLAWNKSNGVWETEPNITEAKKVRNHPHFNAYVFFLIIHNVLTIYFWIVNPSYPELDLTIQFTWGIIIFSSIVINSLALFAIVKKGLPLQILLVPILDFMNLYLPSFFSDWLWHVAMESYFFAIVNLIPLIWVLYIRFIFLNPQPIARAQRGVIA